MTHCLILVDVKDGKMEIIQSHAHFNVVYSQLIYLNLLVKLQLIKGKTWLAIIFWIFMLVFVCIY